MRVPSKNVIIKKSPRRGGGEAHGGAWKVAFADFTLAMMAFFLVLWLISVSTQDEREYMAAALRDYSILNGRPTPFKNDGGVIPSTIKTYASLIDTQSNNFTSPGGKPNQSNSSDQIKDGKTQGEKGPGQFDTAPSMTILKNVIEKMAQDLEAQENISVEVTPQGLRIRLQDDQNRQMFSPGGTRMDPFFEDLLLEMAPMLLRARNGLLISGHTDARPFNGDPLEYSNWELSSERAAMARKVLQAGGVPNRNLVQIIGMSDTALINKINPFDQVNRRIEIMVLTKEAEDQIRTMFGLNESSRPTSNEQPVSTWEQDSEIFENKTRGQLTLEDMGKMTEMKRAASNNQPTFR